MRAIHLPYIRGSIRNHCGTRLGELSIEHRICIVPMLLIQDILQHLVHEQYLVAEMLHEIASLRVISHKGERGPKSTPDAVDEGCRTSDMCFFLRLLCAQF